VLYADAPTRNARQYASYNTEDSVSARRSEGVLKEVWHPRPQDFTVSLSMQRRCTWSLTSRSIRASSASMTADRS